MEKNIPGRVDKQLRRGIPKEFDSKELHPNSLLVAENPIVPITSQEILEAYKIILDKFSIAEEVIGKELSNSKIAVSDFPMDTQECIINLFGSEQKEITFGDYKRLLEFCSQAGQEVAEDELTREGVI